MTPGVEIRGFRNSGERVGQNILYFSLELDLYIIYNVLLVLLTTLDRTPYISTLYDHSSLREGRNNL